MIDTSPLYTVSDLGILPGFESSYAVGLNDRGQVIGSLSRKGIDFSSHGFLWTEGQMRDLGNVYLKSINNKGHVVGAKRPKYLQFSAIIYSAGRFTPLLKNTSAMSIAECINDSGQVVGLMQAANQRSPAETKRGGFVWADGKRRYLDAPEGYQVGNAVSLNSQGQIVGELWETVPNEHYTVLNKRHAVLWEGDSITLLNEPPGFNESEAVAINNQGLILVRTVQSTFNELISSISEEKGARVEDMQEFIDSLQQKIAAQPQDVPFFRQQSFLWQNGQMQMVDGLATALNDQGQVVGWSGCDLGAKALAKGGVTPYAFLWQNGELIDLNDIIPPESGWHLTRANGINNNGQIAGHGKVDGKTRAFLLTPIKQ